MLSRFQLGFTVLGIVAVAMICGCDRPPSRVYGPPFSPSSEASAAMDMYDTNKDGKIAGPELEKAPGVKAALKVMKTDKDKGATKEQIAERIQKWRDSRIGRTSLSCMVMRKGQPLVGASVKFVPEKFLEDALKKTATGTTNQTGMAMMTIQNDPGEEDLPPGIPPGMYRVEITKAGDNIPAKYNTATVLGQEVSLDNLDMQLGIKYNLDY